jgi:RNA polymerase sigma-70 factor (ECF subfamily)
MRMPLMVTAAAEPSEVDWSAFYAALHSFVAARVRTASDVDDLVHVILERAISKSADVEIHNAPAWLFGIARNAVADHYRVQARALISDAEALDAAAPLGSSDDERAQVLGCMAPLLATLSADSARLLRWADMEGRTMQAIADELDITLTAAKSRVQRARKEFVKATRDCCAITVDARGRVTSLTPKNHPAAVECETNGSCCPTDSEKCS